MQSIQLPSIPTISELFSQFAFDKSFGEFGCFWSSATLNVWNVDTGQMVSLPALLIRDQRAGMFIATGADAEKISQTLPEGQEVVRPFSQGKIAENEAARVLFQTAFQQLLQVRQLPLWFFPKLQIVSLNQQYPIYERAVTKLCQNLGCRATQQIVLSELIAQNFLRPAHSSITFCTVILGEDITEMSLISKASQQLVHQIKFGIQHVRSQLLFQLKSQLNLDISEGELFRLLEEYASKGVRLHVNSKGQRVAWRTTVRGKDSLKGELVSAVVSSEQLTPLVQEAFSLLSEQMTNFFEQLSGEFASDLMKQGVVLVETQTPFPGLSQYLSTQLGIPFTTLEWQEVLKIKST